MKEISSKVIIIIADFLAIIFALSIAYALHSAWDVSFSEPSQESYMKYLTFYGIYITIFASFMYENIYIKRYDFWHESRQIIKALIVSFLLVMTILALTDTIHQYSRMLIFMTFIIISIVLPFVKFIVKKKLYSMGLRKRKAKIVGNDRFIENEIFNNHYLGYIKSDRNAKTVFINPEGLEAKSLKIMIDQEIKMSHEVIFIPLINSYNLMQSDIYELSNTRTNLIVYQNRLKSKSRLLLQQIFNYGLAIILLPILIPVIAAVSFLIKKESPGDVFFAHNRLGQGGKIIPTLKFRSMYQDAEERLEKLLSENEEVRKEWEINFKLKDDPRVTKIGAILRKTSLDELPQIFNVLKGEMSFVGPRPVIQKEIDQYYKEDAEYYFMVKPGITGLWQVSGRSDTDYEFRVATDKWYVSNWSLWLDIVVLFKTVKVVLLRDGAY